MSLPKDYKRAYLTDDGVAVDPTDEVFICAIDTDSFNYVPKSVTAKQAEDAGERTYFSTYELCESKCHDANSL